MNDTAHPLAKYIDHTLLKPDAARDDLEKLCREAIEHQFYAVCVNGVNVATCTELVSDSNVLVCGVVGFPLGATKTEIKLLETKHCLEDGATEIDMVINIGALKEGKHDLVRDEIGQIASLCHTSSAILKVIIETCLLSDVEKEIACKLVKEAEADFVKTSTGFSSGGATIKDLKLMRAIVGEEIGVKASGGVKADNVLEIIEATKPGPFRIGASASVSIINAVNAQEAL